ncbi:hypothetical protein CFP56_007264, partial [Quercus suber]
NSSFVVLDSSKTLSICVQVLLHLADFVPKDIVNVLLHLADDPNVDIKLTYDNIKAFIQPSRMVDIVGIGIVLCTKEFRKAS